MIKKIMLFSLTFVIGLCLLEVVLRSFFPIYFTGLIGAYQYDERLGVRVKPDIHFKKNTDYLQEISTNKLGTINFQESFAGYEKLIIAIGDSFTMGTGLPEDANYPFQLDLMLNVDSAGYSKKYGVVNLGLAAYGSKQSILVLKDYVKTLGVPAYILYFGCENDFSDDQLFDNGYTHKHLVDGNPKYGAWLKPLQWATNELEIGKRLKMLRGSISRVGLSEGDSGGEDKAVNVARSLEPSFAELKSYADSIGAKLIVSWTAPPTETESYAWLKNWSSSNGVGFADWHPLVQSTLSHYATLEVSNDHSGGHYRVWVNNLIAKAFRSQISTFENKVR